MIIIAIPAYNEEKIIKDNVLKLLGFCRRNLGDEFLIVVVENNSSDNTLELALSLSRDYQEIEVVSIMPGGKGRAIREVWMKYEADVYVFMDADLATDILFLPELVGQIKRGGEIAIGSRFARSSQVKRSLFRKIFSHGYRVVVKSFLQSKINDLPCGFKAVNLRVRNDLLPQVQDNEWFFDSELMLLGEKQGYIIKEVPVCWQENLSRGKSRVNVFKTSYDYLKKIWEIKNRL